MTLYDYMHRLGGPMARSASANFSYTARTNRDAVYKRTERGYQFPEITSWIRASKKDFELVRDLGLKETGVLVSCSDYHIFYKMKMTRKQAMESYGSVIRDLPGDGYHSPVPSGGYHPFGYLRLCDSVLL